MDSGGNKRVGPLARPAAWTLSLLAVAGLGLLLLTPTARGAARLAFRLTATAKSLSRAAPGAPPSLTRGRLFGGTPAVGALFTIVDGHLGRHFCTASVVDSPVRDLIITAAHCVSQLPTGPAAIAFVPGYHSGLAPHGTWYVTAVITDQAWRSSRSINDDVAFLVVAPANGTRIQEVTGGERLGIGWSARQAVRVIGYPDQRDRPVTCRARTRAFGRQQMEFDCGGYTNGTSGGPFLTRESRRTGRGTVMGVIGGYQQGGDFPAVSYSIRFGPAVWKLYLAAVARG